MDVLELPNKSERVVSFAWEPRGHRFAVVHGDGARPNVSFYSMRDDRNRLAPRLLGEWMSAAVAVKFFLSMGWTWR
jgi:translation initiation factor 3 subunit B